MLSRASLPAILLLSLLSPLAAQETAPAPLIRSHLFPGRVWIPQEDLEARLGLPPGSRFTAEAEAEALARLLSWRFIRSAGPPEVRPADAGRVDLAWPVVERLLVRSVHLEVRPSGRGPVLDIAELRKGLRTRAGEPLLEETLEADRESLRARHLAEGLLLCEAQAEPRPAGPGAVEVIFTVDEGHRVAIDSIELSGNREIPTGHVRAVMETRPAILLGIISRGVLIPEKLERDLERIRRLYRERGYLDAVVFQEPPRFSPDLSRVTISIRVEEGLRYRLQAVEVQGNGPGVPAELLLRQVRARNGEFWDGRTLEDDRRRIIRWYEERYGLVPRVSLRFRPSLDPADPRLTAILAIDEEDRVFAGRVDIRGNLLTRDRVLRRALEVVPGEPLTGLELETSGEGLAALGYFEPESIRLTAPPGGAQRSVEVEVKEKRTGLFQMGGGASTGEGEIAYLSLVQTNFDLLALPGPRRPWSDAFTGGGQILQLEFAPGTSQSEFLFRFEEPYLHDSRNSLSLLAATRLYDRDDYDETRVRGEAALRRHLDPDRRLSVRLAWVVEDVRISDISAGAPDDVTGVRGHTLLSYPGLRLAWQDFRLDPWSGPLGSMAELRGDFAHRATGSEESFLRAVFSGDLHLQASRWLNSVLPGDPLNEAPGHEHVLHLGGKVGVVEGLREDETPIFERFFLGGPRSVRGFDYRELGPEESGVRIGGEAFYQGTVEYSFPLALRELRGVVFFDFADLEEDFDELGTGRIRTAAGLGLRIRPRLLNQVVPVDLYWAFPLRTEPEDDTRVFSFTVGFGF